MSKKTSSSKQSAAPASKTAGAPRPSGKPAAPTSPATPDRAAKSPAKAAPLDAAKAAAKKPRDKSAAQKNSAEKISPANVVPEKTTLEHRAAALNAREKFDVLVLGDHPAASLAAAALVAAGVPTIQACIPGQSDRDRLVTINPAIFDLHPLLGGIRKKLDLTPLFGLRFLADDAATESSTEKPGAAPSILVGEFKHVRDALLDAAKTAGVPFVKPKNINFDAVDETGVHVALDRRSIHAKLLLVAGDLPAAHRKLIGIDGGWESGILRRYTYVRLDPAKQPPDLVGKRAEGRPLLPMSLDLGGKLHWAWLLPSKNAIQLAVEQSTESAAALPGPQLLQQWAQVLIKHNVIKGPVDTSRAISLDLPFGGALAQEGVANRTLLIGPAGGFYTACGEDIYPNCWSALFAVDVVKAALKEQHLQDALQPFREKWGASLGDYLRGPQQNLRFLLPLVYRNPMMTSRLADAILTGESVVR